MDDKIQIQYGSLKSQFGELYLPHKSCLGTVCLFHGGFWSMPYGLDQFDKVSEALTEMGYCVWNIEYRRIGESNYEWKNAFDDAILAINELVNVKEAYPKIDLDNVYTIGHSAGGHLAIWLNSQKLKVRIKKCIGLAPILDLELAHRENAGNGAVQKLLQGLPHDHPERYAYASPILAKSKNAPEVIVHGTEDDYVPAGWSEQYRNAIDKQLVDVDLIIMESCGHMDFIDANSAAFEKVLQYLA